MVDPDFVFIVRYACPRCQAPLEARLTGPPRWLRCPTCGRAGLPPEADRIADPPLFGESDPEISPPAS